MIKLFNSLSRTTEEFKPIDAGKAGLYTCGPTVYHYVHIGNLRTYLLSDILRRVLEYNKYSVNSVMNITDVGHLTSDSDTGEDKMEKAKNNMLYIKCVICHKNTPTFFSVNPESLKSTSLINNFSDCIHCGHINIWSNNDVFYLPAQDDKADLERVNEIILKYTDSFLTDIQQLNILAPAHLPKASQEIPGQISLIQTLIEKGFAYESDEAVYFDVAKFPSYNLLTGQKLSDMMLGARQEVVKDAKKKNPIDFVLWFKAVGRYANHILRWDSPWGVGFPGWHIECSAMSKHYLGNHFDIHVGGIDLKFPHHTNEIAQSECGNGEKFVNYWMHGEFLLINEDKMAKSDGNLITLKTLQDKGFSPLAYRYLTLTAHYRSKLNFTWESLQGAQNALNNLYSELSSFDAAAEPESKFITAFTEAVNDDLDMPRAIATMWNLVKNDEVSTGSKLATLFSFDEILGLNFREVWENSKNIPDNVKQLVSKRETARANKDFQKSDELRNEIEKAGFILEDSVDGLKLKKKF